MKNVFALAALLAVLSPAAFAQAITAAPTTMNFQGRLAKKDGTPVPDGVHTVTFRIYDAQVNGTLRWIEQIGSVVTKNGTFSAVLGKFFPFNDTIFNGTPWLEIQIENDAPLIPRQTFQAVAYALKANTVPDGAITTVKIADGAITAAKLAPGVGFALPFTAIVSTDNAFNITNNGDHGRAFLGTSLNGDGVAGISTDGAGIYGISTNNRGVVGTSTNGNGIQGQSTNQNGIFGIAFAVSTAGVHGENTKGFGVYGQSSGDNGVYGVNTGNNGSGVAGVSTNAIGTYGGSTNNVGVYGLSVSNYGVFGVSTSNTGVHGISSTDAGVEGFSTSGVGLRGGSTNGYGIYGNSTNSYAGYFNGSIYLAGNMEGPSDVRFKTNIITLNNALDTVLSMRGVNFDWKQNEFKDRHFGAGRQVGFIAQELETVLPELVHTDREGYKSVDYIHVVPVLVEAIKAQQQKIDAQGKQLAKINDLEAQLAALTASLHELKAAQEKAKTAAK